MRMYAVKAVLVLTAGSTVLASGGCSTVVKAFRGPCGVISHALASVEDAGDSRHRYTAEDAPTFQKASEDISIESMTVDKQGQLAATHIARDLDDMADKLERLPPGETAVYVVRGSREEDLPPELQEACKDPDPSSDF